MTACLLLPALLSHHAYYCLPMPATACPAVTSCLLLPVHACYCLSMPATACPCLLLPALLSHHVCYCLQRNKCDVFEVTGSDVGEIAYIIIGHDNTGAGRQLQAWLGCICFLCVCVEIFVNSMIFVICIHVYTVVCVCMHGCSAQLGFQVRIRVPGPRGMHLQP